MPTTTVMPTTAAPTTTIAPTTAAPTTTIAPTTAAPTTTSTTPEPCWSVAIFPELPDCYNCVANSEIKPNEIKIEEYKECKDCVSNFETDQYKCSMPACLYADIGCCEALEVLLSQLKNVKEQIFFLQRSIQSYQGTVDFYVKGFEDVNRNAKLFTDENGNYLSKNDVITNIENLNSTIIKNKNQEPELSSQYDESLKENNNLLKNLKDDNGNKYFEDCIDRLKNIKENSDQVKTKEANLQIFIDQQSLLEGKIPSSNFYCLLETISKPINEFIFGDGKNDSETNNKQVFADYARNKIRA